MVHTSDTTDNQNSKQVILRYLIKNYFAMTYYDYFLLPIAKIEHFASLNKKKTMVVALILPHTLNLLFYIFLPNSP